MDIFADVNGGIQCEVTAKIVTARRKYIAIRCTAIDSYALSTPRLAAHRQLTVYLFQFRGKSDFLLGLVVADGGMRLAAEAVRVRLGGRVLLCQHQLLVSLVVPDLVLVVVDEKFAAVILFRAGGNDAVHAARALGHADACARVQFAADGDGIAVAGHRLTGQVRLGRFRQGCIGLLQHGLVEAVVKAGQVIIEAHKIGVLNRQRRPFDGLRPLQHGVFPV